VLLRSATGVSTETEQAHGGFAEDTSSDMAHVPGQRCLVSAPRARHRNIRSRQNDGPRLAVEAGSKEDSVSNRAWIGAAVVAMFIGCRMTGHPGPSRTEAPSSLDEGAVAGSPPSGDGAGAVAAGRDPTDAGVDAAAQQTDAVECPAPCPDPPNCACGNGTGVYAAEGGFAGIIVQAGRDGRVAPLPIMITHFINNGPGLGSHVTFGYGYFDPFTNQWHSLGKDTGQVDTADYGERKNLKVISVHEGSTPTMPIWELLDPGTNGIVRTDPQLPAPDPAVPALSLHISFPVPGTGTQVAVKSAFLTFRAAPSISRNKGSSIYTYFVQWENRSDPSIALPQQYCQGPNHKPDTVVFQQGIDVDPSTGNVTHPNVAPNVERFVTLSCSLGAPAKVFSWGYQYQGAAPVTFYFDAGIHMKRASYCADVRHYTRSGTDIEKLDDKFINRPIDLSSPAAPDVEAWWGPEGALCVNSERMRHPEMAPTDIGLMNCGGKPYNGQPQSLQKCSFVCNVKQLPKCLPNLRKPPWPQFLIDRPAP
jgi:hypothetical protein